MNRYLRSAISRLTWQILRVARVPRIHQRISQRAITQGTYELRVKYSQPLPSTDPRHLTWHENSVYSQNGEDGILQFLFSEVGATSKNFIEFGVEDGTECNSAFLAIAMGWSGLLMDGSSENARRGRVFYSAMAPHQSDSIQFKDAWITRDNINDLIAESNLAGEIDLLSIDVDGNDYWIWRVIDGIRPRVTVVEYNATFGPERSVTVPYEADFDRMRKHPTGFYHGASLAALEKLGREKGYRLVGCESTGVNAFFVHEDLSLDSLPPFSAREAFIPHRARLLRGYSTEQQMAEIAHLPLIEV
jgi:hypothetical protein